MAGRRPAHNFDSPQPAGWETGNGAHTSGPQAHTDKYPQLPDAEEVHDLESLRRVDPKAYERLQEVITLIKLEMIPVEAQQALVEAMSSGVKRELVSRIAGLDSSILMNFKTQMTLIEAVLSRVINPDGTANSAGNGLDISIKEAINMSIKLTTAMATHLPKFVKLEKIQRMEQAFFEVVESMLSKEQQIAVLDKMDQLNLEAMRKEG